MKRHTNLSFKSNRPVKDTMHSQDRWLRRIDDWCTQEGPKDSTVTDGEGASIHIFYRQFTYKKK